VQLVKEDAIATYSIVNNTIFYKAEEELRSFNLITLEDKKILDKVSMNISADTTYLYVFDDNGLLSVYNHQGELVCKVSNHQIISCHFGDGTYIFGTAYDNTKEQLFGTVIEVSDFADGKANWTYFSLK
ncbi:MAG: hypothetical protein IKJ01_05895, partial [Lachnospiraceae bacterium]|nr:hypothetical protein [Lachnospiraceae bacterium]